jgi:hypothetical protein
VFKGLGISEQLDGYEHDLVAYHEGSGSLLSRSCSSLPMVLASVFRRWRTCSSERSVSTDMTLGMRVKESC